MDLRSVGGAGDTNKRREEVIRHDLTLLHFIKDMPVGSHYFGMLGFILDLWTSRLR